MNNIGLWVHTRWTVDYGHWSWWFVRQNWMQVCDDQKVIFNCNRFSLKLIFFLQIFEYDSCFTRASLLGPRRLHVPKHSTLLIKLITEWMEWFESKKLYTYIGDEWGLAELQDRSIVKFTTRLNDSKMKLSQPTTTRIIIWAAHCKLQTLHRVWNYKPWKLIRSINKTHHGAAMLQM